VKDRDSDPDLISYGDSVRHNQWYDGNTYWSMGS
jgi:hypothetical protein